MTRLELKAQFLFTLGAILMIGGMVAIVWAINLFHVPMFFASYTAIVAGMMVIGWYERVMLDVRITKAWRRNEQGSAFNPWN